MSKVIGITPGPVQFENMEESDVKQFNPTNTGSTGQVLTKTSNGYKWQTPSGGGSSDVGFNFVDETGFSFYTADVSHMDILVNEPETFSAVISYSITLRDANSNDEVDNLTASIVFNRKAGESYYWADASLSAKETNGDTGKYFVLINGVFKASVVFDEDNHIDLTFEGTAMFSKNPSPQASSVLRNITKVSIRIDSINICVNQ